MYIRAALLVLICTASTFGNARAQGEPAHTMQSAAERASERPTGQWQGNYIVRRIDPRLTTLGASELLRVQVIQDRGAATATLDFAASRAICIDPLDDPCEWIGATEVVPAVITATGLYAELSIAVDRSFFLHLSAPDNNAEAALFALDGEVNYSAVLERDDTQ